MAEKTDEEIIKEVGLETTNDVSEEDALAALSFDNDTSNESTQKTRQNNEAEELTPISSNESNTRSDNNQNDTQEQDNVIENEDKDDERKKVDNEVEEEIPVQKKQPKIYKILMIVVAILASILVIGLILYFTGFFEPEKPMPKPIVEKVEMNIDEEIEFDDKNINKDKLNKKLTALTKTEIMNKEELEAEEKRIQEEERKKKEEEQKALEEKQRLEDEKKQAELAKIEEERRLLEEHRLAIKKEQEEFLKLQEEAQKALEEQKNELLKQINQIPESVEEENINEPIQEENTQTNLETPMKEQLTEEEKEEVKMFMPFINVATIKGELFKEYLDKVQTFDKKLSLCRDSKNRIEIYFGPYESEKERTKVLDNLVNNGFKESYLVDFTKEEYEKRCKY